MFKRRRLGSFGEFVTESVEDQKTEIGSSDGIGKSKAETEEPSDTILSRQVLSLPMEVPNDKDVLRGPPPLHPFGSNAQLAAANGFELVEIQVPKEKVDLITGRGGETIRNMLTITRTSIELTPRDPSNGGQSDEWIVRITGKKNQTRSAREMIKDILNQTVKKSHLSSEYIQQLSNRLRGLLAPHQRYRGSSHHLKFASYQYPQRAQYPSSNGNPPPVAPRIHAPEEAPASSGPMPQTYHNPSDGSAPASAGYGQTYPNNPAAAASSGYVQPVAGSDQQPGVQQQPQAYPQAGYGLCPAPRPAVFAEQQQPAANNAAAYGWYQAPVDPAAYGAPPQQGPPSYFGNYLPPVALRSHFPEGAPLQGPARTYRRSSPTSQQHFSYAPRGPMQQTYLNPPYGSAPVSAGFGQTYPNNPPAAASSGYGQPVAGYGPQHGVQQQPQAYPQAGYGLYPVSQPQQLAANNAAAYGYQAPVDPAAFGAPPQRGPPAAAYPQAGYGLYPVPRPAVFAEQQQSVANNVVAYGYQAPVFPAAFGAPPQWGPPAAAYHVAAAYAAQPTRARFGNLASVAPGAWYGGYGAQQQQQQH